MNEPAILATLAAQDAAEANIALGWMIQLRGYGTCQWRIGDVVWTDDELTGLVLHQSVRMLTGAGRASAGRQ